LTRYGGLIHDYGLLNPLAEVPAVKTALTQVAAVIKDTLKEKRTKLAGAEAVSAF
jgi:hypothetical protein